MRLNALILVTLFAGCSTPPSAPADLGRDLVLVFPEGCNNGARDGNETDVDCGGDTCKKCEAGKACLHGSDCTSTICDNNVCAAPSCTDKLLNGSETDVDCGGGCPGCAVGQKCSMSADCASGSCVNNVCQPGACMNNIKDGMETDIDCGGPTCPACPDGKACLMATDCKGTHCVNNVCQGAINCTPPMANCDGNPQSGCNVNLNADAKNCGKCGSVCPINMPTCSNGKCQGGTEVVEGFSMPFNTSITVNANKMELFRVYPQKPSTLLRFGVVGKVAGPKFIAALYTMDKNGMPSQLVASSAPTPLVVGPQEVAALVRASLPVDTYWLTMIFDSQAQIGGQPQSSTLMWELTWNFTDPLPMTFPKAFSSNLFTRNIWIVVLE